MHLHTSLAHDVLHNEFLGNHDDDSNTKTIHVIFAIIIRFSEDTYIPHNS